MGAISIFISRFLSLYIGKVRKVFNLPASFLSDFRTHPPSLHRQVSRRQKKKTKKQTVASQEPFLPRVAPQVQPSSSFNEP
jgi:hypothetical protein